MKRLMQYLCIVIILFESACFSNDEVRKLKKDALNGDVSAQVKLCKIYKNGDGVIMNKKEALKWLEMAADNGDRKSLHEIAWLYAYSKIVKKDLNKSFQYTLKAAQLNVVDSQKNVAVLYYLGHGTPQNFYEALMWDYIAFLNGCERDIFILAMAKKQFSPDLIREIESKAKLVHSNFKEKPLYIE